MFASVNAFVISAVVSFSVGAYAQESCQNLFAQNGVHSTLQKLRLVLSKPAPIPHTLEIRDGRGYIKIGMLNAKDMSISIALMAAVRAGTVAEIDTGIVIGPKVLSMLYGMKRIVNMNRSLILKGTLDPSSLRRTMLRHAARNVDPVLNSARNVRHYADSELEDFYESISLLNIERACKELYKSPVSTCGAMNFIFDARMPELVRWTKA